MENRSQNSAWDYTDRLYELVAQRLEVLQAMLDHSLQAGCEGTSDPSAAVRLLARRQGLFDRLMELEQQLNPYRYDDPQQRHWRDASKRAECRRMLARSEELMRRILDFDSQMLAQMESARGILATQLQTVASSSDVSSAYAAANTLESPQLDITEG
ncbi:MAG: hypothetical protein KatS3mg111_4393 [Pirellulaceae bacterium]|nr:MAG: hypothetical protein KatS3mg111_4393 [Pirellulaceae bacterium]